MQTDYLNRLAPDVRTFAEELEQAIGFEIVVKVNHHKPRRASDEPGGLECEVDQSGARILIPEPGWFPDGSVLHELFHIRRFLVEGIPLLVDNEAHERWNPCVSTAVTYHDNCMEHLIIVPEELRRRPERRAHWERAMTQVWETLSADGTHEIDRRQGALANWVFIQHVMPGSAARTSALAVLDRFDFRESAEGFFEALVPALTDKEQLVRVWFEYLNIPLEMASLRYLNAWGGLCRETPLT
jgi:hypothetical protein